MIVENMNSVTAALAPLLPNDSATYAAQGAEVAFNITLKLSPESLERLITKETISNEAEMILMVKRPDYLGAAMWEFRHENRVVSAKITDSEWLLRFQQRHVDV